MEGNMNTTEHQQKEQQAQPSVIQSAYAKLPAKDVNRARAFWREKFGLEPVSDHDDHLRYQVGAAQFLVFPSSGEASGTHDQLGLIVTDVEGEVARLRSLGLRFEEYEIPVGRGTTMTNGIIDRGFMKAAWFKDTEGNLISINQFMGGLPSGR